MPRPRNDITLHNMQECLNYFINIFKNYNRAERLEISDQKRFESQNVLIALYDRQCLAKSREEKLEIIRELKIWLETYISPKDWSRYLMTIRQKRYCKNNKIKLLKLPKHVYEALYLYAKNANLPLWEAVYGFVVDYDCSSEQKIKKIDQQLLSLDTH